MKPARPRALEPKTLVLHDVAAYLGLGSSQAAERWLKAHRVFTWIDGLGYTRCFVREIDEANHRAAAEAESASRRLRQTG